MMLGLAKSLLKPVVTIARKVGPLNDAINRVKVNWDLHRAFRSTEWPPILVYQMGKVGSMTVVKSLQATGLPFLVFHGHFLAYFLPESSDGTIPYGVTPDTYQYVLSEALVTEFSRRPAFPIKVISLVRDPIARQVSALFQTPELYVGEERKDAILEPASATEYLARRFAEETEFDFVNSWFDLELKTVFGIDVFSRPFDKDRGFSVYSNGRVDALVIRLEDLSTKGPKAIGEFLGLPRPLPLVQDNVREDTKDKEAYRVVKRELRVPPDVCQQIYASKFVRHFYSDETIEKFTAQWTRERS